MDYAADWNALPSGKKGVDRSAILNDELGKEQALMKSDPNEELGPHSRNVQDITGELGRLGSKTPSPAQAAQPAANDYAAEWNALPSEKAPEVKTEVPKATAEQPGKLASFGAGAGEAVGRGALSVQQLLGKGVSSLGDLVGVDAMKSAGDWLNKDAVQAAKKLGAENAPYEEANPKTNIAGQVGGFVFSPINKLVPGGAAPATLLGGAAKGAAQGAALSALSQPVTDEDKSFLGEKAKQAGVGAIGGAVGGTIAHGISQGINKALEFFQRAGNRLAASPAQAEELVAKAIQENGGDAAGVKAARPELFDGIKSQVADALSSGKKVDPMALQRLTEAQTLPVPVPMLKGQITRDAMQFAKEQNLRGINGVGEPITETLKTQNRALIENLDALGADKGSDVVTAGKAAIDILRASDKEASSKVGAAYKAFKDATGKDLQVPLTGLAQDYAKTVKEFGDAIPSAIRGKFEDLGLMSGKAKTMFSIEDAEALVKSINRNYDPKNIVQARALDDLRRSVQKSISEGAGSDAEGTAAAGIAKAARSAAKNRFDLIDATPALKAAIRNDQPDAFVQKFILQGNTAEVKSMMRTIESHDPQAAEALRDSMMNVIKQKVLNNQSSENGVFSQAQLKQFVSDPRMAPRIKEAIGPERFQLLSQLNRVAENSLYAPKAAAVNTSNTASAAANLVKEEVQGGSVNSLLDVMKKVPGLTTASQVGQQTYQGARAAALVRESVNPSVAGQTGANRVIDLLAKHTRPDLIAQRTGAAVLDERKRRTDRR